MAKHKVGPMLAALFAVVMVFTVTAKTSYADIDETVARAGLSISKGKTTKTYSICIEATKTGKTTISYTYKGKTRKVALTVRKCSNPVKSLKIGKTDFANKYKKWDTYINDPAKYAGQKIKVTPAKGWKLDKIVMTYSNSSGKVVQKKIKNGAILPKTLENIESRVILGVRLRNTKTKGVTDLEMLARN